MTDHLPSGGMPGTVHIWGEDDTSVRVIQGEFAKEGKTCCGNLRSTECAGQVGILNGKKAACHPI